MSSMQATSIAWHFQEIDRSLCMWKHQKGLPPSQHSYHWHGVPLFLKWWQCQLSLKHSYCSEVLTAQTLFHTNSVAEIYLLESSPCQPMFNGNCVGNVGNCSDGLDHKTPKLKQNSCPSCTSRLSSRPATLNINFRFDRQERGDNLELSQDWCSRSLKKT